MVVQLHPHQIKAVEELANGKVLWGGVGVGKSITALAYFYTKICGGTLNDRMSMTTPKDLLIITTAKKRDSLDWLSEAIPFGLSTDPKNSTGGIKITVDSWNNIDRYLLAKDIFVIWDEQKAIGAGKWSKSFIKISKQNQWIMLSATPGDTWLDMIPLFVANGLYKNRTEFKRQHVVYAGYSKFPKVDHYIEVGKLIKARNNLLVEMPYERHTVRVSKDVLVEYDRDLMDKVVKKRWHVYEQRPLKDAAELFSVMRKVANSDPSRLNAVQELIVTHPRLIVFYNFNYELEQLRTLKDIPDLHVAEWNGHKHEPVPTSEKWLYLVQYVAGAEGWNCVSTDAMVFYSQTYSYKNLHQAHGRIDRLNTPYTELYYYVLKSKAAIDIAVGKALKGKKNFQEKDYYTKF